MIKGYFLLINLSLPFFVSQLTKGVEKETLIWIIFILSILLAAILFFELRKVIRNNHSISFSRLFRQVHLVISLDKDRPFRPQVLTMTIRNTGKNEADINAPVLEYRKIWSTRKFKLNGVSGNQIYPMFIDAGKVHQLRIETLTFYQYDRSIKSYYWARILVSDVEGRKWRSNRVKLRKSLVT
jgi:hypothetical protein